MTTTTLFRPQWTIRFPPVLITTKPNDRGAIEAMCTSQKWMCCQVTICCYLVYCKAVRQVNTLFCPFQPPIRCVWHRSLQFACRGPKSHKGLGTANCRRDECHWTSHGELGYALYSGEVFKKVKSSKYTYHHSWLVKKFLFLMANNDQFKATTMKNLNRLVEILGDKDCESMKQLHINYDLTKVNGG